MIKKAELCEDKNIWFNKLIVSWILSEKSPMYENQNGCSDPSWLALKVEPNLYNDQKSYLA